MEHTTNNIPKQLKLLPYYLFTLYLGIFITILGGISYRNEMGLIALALGVLILIAALVLSFVCLYGVWNYIITQFNKQGFEPPILSPGQAVGLLFVPFYNFYWVFQAYGQLPKCLNKLTRSRNGHILLPDSLGNLIGAFIVSGIVPYLGSFLSLIANFILFPVLLYKSVKAILEMPDFVGAAKADEVIIDRKTEPVPLEKVKDLMQLFHTAKKGLNFPLFLFLTGAGFISSLLHILLVNVQYGSGFSLNSLLTPIFQIVPIAIYSFLYVLVLYLVKSRHLLALFYGIIGIFSSAVGYSISLLFSHSFSSEMIKQFFSIQSMTMYIAPFIVGVVLIYGLSLGIKLWGFKYGSILFGHGLAYLLPIIGGTLATLTTELLSVRQMVFIPVFNTFSYSLAYYWGLKWHLSSGIERTISQNQTEILDSDL